ncbi:MAG: UbiA prenyltransferase family protein [Phycisphaerales bacterium]|nr:UbiA prenyltransferase family protein [Phycisphaerales bacterium]
MPALDLIRLARPAQWSKGVFLLLGPAYGLADGKWNLATGWLSLALALVVFSLASSACYIVNDLLDAPADRKHPRKMHRPIASGRVSPVLAIAFAGVLLALCGVALFFMPPRLAIWTLAGVGIYVINVMAYSAVLKHIVIADVVSLSVGFVLRVLVGCAAVGVSPTTWLLNTTFFLAMFLAFGKRLGERRLLGGEGATQARGVQAGYTDELLRLTVVVTAVVSLVTYAGYVQNQQDKYQLGFNLLWLTILPATYALLRAIVLLERGTYDDPTILATRDRPFQLAGILFGAMTLALMWARHSGWVGAALVVGGTGPGT